MEIVRQDFPRSADGYDRAAVDAHLEAIAAAVPAERPGADVPADHVLAAGRELLGQISRLRVELKNVSAALREQGVRISDALEELVDLGPDAETAAAGPGTPLVPAAAEAEPSPEPAGVRAPAAAMAAAPPTAVEDARLVALDMALGGRSRAEIERELARFELPDRAALVDAVLAAIG